MQLTTTKAESLEARRTVWRERMTSSCAACALLFCSLAGGASDATPPQVDSPSKSHRIIESGFMISTHPRQIYWLDSDRVLFAGQRGLPPSGKHGLGIYLWDLRTNNISLYAGGSTLCYFQGFIRYLTSGRGGQAMIVEGRFGEPPEPERLPGLSLQDSSTQRVWFCAGAACRGIRIPRLR